MDGVELRIAALARVARRPVADMRFKQGGQGGGQGPSCAPGPRRRCPARRREALRAVRGIRTRLRYSTDGIGKAPARCGRTGPAMRTMGRQGSVTLPRARRCRPCRAGLALEQPHHARPSNYIAQVSSAPIVRSNLSSSGSPGSAGRNRGVVDACGVRLRVPFGATGDDG